MKKLLIIVSLVIFSITCNAQEQLTYDQLYQLVSNQFKSNSQKFNHLFARIDSLEKRIKKLENILYNPGGGLEFVPCIGQIEQDFDPGIEGKDTINVIPFDSAFYQNAVIIFNDRPDSIWPGLWRPGVSYKHKNEKEKIN
jgi:hypothetical protein